MNSCFWLTQEAPHVSSIKLIAPVSAKVVGGALLQSTEYFPNLTWSAGGTEFQDNFRILKLGSYDGIIGLDWLGKFSPMVTHWEQGWLAIQNKGQTVVLCGEGQSLCTHALVEMQLIRENMEPVSPEVQALLDEYAVVFATPTGLPPSRVYDHQIPLISGA